MEHAPTGRSHSAKPVMCRCADFDRRSMSGSSLHLRMTPSPGECAKTQRIPPGASLEECSAPPKRFLEAALGDQALEPAYFRFQKSLTSLDVELGMTPIVPAAVCAVATAAPFTNARLPGASRAIQGWAAVPHAI